MKKLFVLFIAFYSINLFACSIHSFKVELDKKILLRTNSFHAHSLVKNNENWDLEIKLTKKIQTKFENILNQNQDKNLIYSFNKQIVSIKSDSNLKLIKMSLNLNDEEIKSLQKDCQAK